MPRPGKDPNYDYTTVPYFVDWEPVPDRKWAMAYIREDGTEDFEGFKKEFRERYPKMFGAADVPSWLPPSVDYFVRHDSSGRRMDIDWELTEIPQTEEELREVAATRKKILEDRRRALKEDRAAREERAAPAKPGAGKRVQEALGETIASEA